MATEERASPTFPHSDAPVLSDNEDADSTIKDALARGLQSPGIAVDSVETRGDRETRSPMEGHLSPPIDQQQWQSPVRQHRRTPSVHREVKETLNARSEYTSDDPDGPSHHGINQYVIKQEIGRGSYGAVHLATDQFGNEYAVKEFSKARLRKRAQSIILRTGPRGPGRVPLRAGFGAPDTPNARLSKQEAEESKDALFLIRQEIAIMKKLNHPNLVQLIEVLDDPEEDSLYMVLEMCKKGVIMKVGIGESAEPYSEESCRYWFRDLILGIEYLHSQGVVHRDIKPDNLLLTEDDVLKVVDFGVSEMFEKTADMRTAKSAGSPAFLPPELCIARHGEIDGKAADIWSMGVSLYCLRYGKIPFECIGVLDMYEAIKNETPQLAPDENPLFVDLMSRLMEKDPVKRITMEELRDHPWVTKGGEDPLLSAEENCSEPIELPNALEVNHAFTRKMNHLLIVMKAISKFKGLLKPKTPIVPKFKAPEESESPTQPSTISEKSTEKPTDAEHSVAEEAARVLRERESLLPTAMSNRGSGLSEPRKGRSRVPQSQSLDTTKDKVTEPLILGVGTGGADDFSRGAGGGGDDEPPDVVSDSPTAVDFNVYDRAFEDEVERIKRSSSRKGRGGRKGTGTMYYTKHLGERAQYKTDENLVWAGGPTSGSSRSGANTPQQSSGGFAELVARAIREEKEKQKVRATKEEGSEE